MPMTFQREPVGTFDAWNARWRAVAGMPPSTPMMKEK
jgi:hypothetical protein